MTVSAPAKVNFTLDVFAPRGDGYHALRSVVMPIALADELEIEESDDFITDTGYGDDLCLKAARALDSERGVCVRVKKRIPVGGGLGGGSADAAAVLLALNEMRGLGLPRERLAELGAQVGSDVPSLVMRSPVLMEGRGEKTTKLEAPCFELVLVNPGVNCSTREVYAACANRSPDSASPTDAMVAALAKGDFDAVAAALSNDLEAPAMRLHPEIAAVKSALCEAGAERVLMSGSGSSVFALARSREAARELAGEMSARGFSSWATHTLGNNMV